MFDGRSFFHVGEYLLPHISDEAVARTVVGRAYYAAFHAGRALAERTGHPLARGPAGHRQLGERLAKIEPAVAEDLNRLRRLRNEADYDTTMTDPQSAAVIAMDLARAVIDSLDSTAGA